MKFGLHEKEWEGPIAFKVEHFKEQAKTARYQSVVSKRYLDFYAPLFMLKGFGGDRAPKYLQVVIWKPTSKNPVLFESIVAKYQFPDVLEYQFSEEARNSVLYKMRYERQEYSLYISNEAFKGLSHPNRVYVQLAVEFGE